MTYNHNIYPVTCLGDGKLDNKCSSASLPELAIWLISTSINTWKKWWQESHATNLVEAIKCKGS